MFIFDNRFYDCDYLLFSLMFFVSAFFKYIVGTYLKNYII